MQKGDTYQKLTLRALRGGVSAEDIGMLFSAIFFAKDGRASLAKVAEATAKTPEVVMESMLQLQKRGYVDLKKNAAGQMDFIELPGAKSGESRRICGI